MAATVREVHGLGWVDDGFGDGLFGQGDFGVEAGPAVEVSGVVEVERNITITEVET